ncbi:bifunctional riboflavin kinase/FAD synthetase [soil metagenome]
MDIYFDAKPGLVERSAIALGFFDGVHPGHQVVIGKAVQEAKRLNVKAGVVTFSDHPRGLTRGQAPLLLTTIEQRLELFASLGLEVALVLTFSEELCKLSPKEYVQNVLTESMGARSISVGHNHHFGRDREGDANLLRDLGGERDFVVHVADMVMVENLEVSSSRIRDLILGKDMELANTLLGRPYSLRGTVVGGEKRGRQLGFPTANVEVAFNQLVPPTGVYVAAVSLNDGSRHQSVVNIGIRPTFNADGEQKPTIEAHLLDFDGDLYGQIVEVALLKNLRDEKKFADLTALKDQIATDCQVARCYLAC